MAKELPRPRFFPTAAHFRRWLERNHASAKELWVGFYKKSTGRRSITWPEAVDEALCFGWIDGIRKSIDEESYTNRFTPRTRGSNWSLINTTRAQQLIGQGRMHSAGVEAFKSRDPKKSGVYSFEQRKNPQFAPELEDQFKRQRDAWQFFEAQPPGYRRLITFYVMSAKQDTTRLRRLELLIKHCAAGRRIDFMRPKGEKWQSHDY